MARRKIPRGGTPEKTFLLRFVVGSPDECWPWIGSRFIQGYGRICVGDKRIGAHRFAWEYHFGPIQKGMYVCHRCDNPPCVNPSHLFLGTHDENMRDRDRKGRNVNLRGEQHARSIYTDEIIRSMRREYDSGRMSQRALARKYNTYQGAICHIVNRRIWKHVADERRESEVL